MPFSKPPHRDTAIDCGRAYLSDEVLAAIGHLTDTRRNNSFHKHTARPASKNQKAYGTQTTTVSAIPTHDAFIYNDQDITVGELPPLSETRLKTEVMCRRSSRNSPEPSHPTTTLLTKNRIFHVYAILRQSASITIFIACRTVPDFP